MKTRKAIQIEGVHGLVRITVEWSHQWHADVYWLQTLGM